MSFHVPNKYRLRGGPLGSTDVIGNNGAFIVRLRQGQTVYVLAGVGGIRMGRQVAQDGVDDLVEVIFLNPHAIPPRREP